VHGGHDDPQLVDVVAERRAQRGDGPFRRADYEDVSHDRGFTRSSGACRGCSPRLGYAFEASWADIQPDVAVSSCGAPTGLDSESRAVAIVA
jgi:hypothetical protein